MKASDIEKGGLYYGKINNKVVVVRVDNIREVEKRRAGYYAASSPKYSTGKVYDVTNTVTNRTTVFKSAAKFRGKYAPPQNS